MKRAALLLALFFFLSYAAIPAPCSLAAEGDNLPPASSYNPSDQMPMHGKARDSPNGRIPDDGGAVVAMTFDDGYASDYTLAYPILKKHGLHGTSYVTAKYPDLGVQNTLTWAQIREMHDDGWEFGAHTYTHARLTKLSSARIRADAEKANASFAANGLPPPDIMAFPYGACNKRVIEALRPYYIQMRGAGRSGRILYPDTIYPCRINCYSGDMQTRKQLQYNKGLVDKAFQKGGILVFRVHCIYREKRNDMGRWPVQTDSRLLEEFIQYCVDKGCTFVTMHELMALYRVES